jgi:acetyltransferase-like isoleucine patch superfamily enzyme
MPSVGPLQSLRIAWCKRQWNSHALEAQGRDQAEPNRAAVSIGDDVCIGTSAIIIKGVTVGAGSVVGAGAVVATDVPDKAIVAGNPARERST